MQHRHLNTLEFSKILERLTKYTAFSASKALALALQPSPYLTEAQNWQTETTEADRLLSVKVNIGVGSARDVRPSLSRAQLGSTLTPFDLLTVRQTLISAKQLKRTITRLIDDYPRLVDIAYRIEECPGVVNQIGQAIDDNGDVKDSASPALARIRKEIHVVHGRLMEKLNKIVGSQASRYLQDTLITQRADRYVLPLKAEFKGKIKGVVHDQSASGATVFLEPLATVELNNKWRQLQLDERDEVNKILAGLSTLVGVHTDLISHTVEALAELDLAFAKAKFGHAIDAVEPFLYDSKHRQTPAGELASFKLLSGRHPLLDTKTVVPITIDLDDDIQMLVITGPNTGGKTVSLKTVGLLAAMAQAGLRIPANEGTTLPVFNQIFADIGDEQSIEQSLSTFSGHMTNVVQILESCDEDSLVIFDELGSGTDPIEGSAMARAILSNLLERNVTTFVATHYSELKAYAHSTPGVVNASMEFNTDTLAPSYRLLIGLPGESNAFTIAQRLGLPAAIIQSAQGLVGEDARQVEAMLAEIKAQTEAAHRVRQLTETERDEAEVYKEQHKQALDEIDVERRDILNSARADARREIKVARERIRDIEAQAQAEIAQLQASVLAQAEADFKAKNGGLVKTSDLPEIETQLESLEKETLPEAAPSSLQVEPELKVVPSGPIRVGDTVFIQQYSTTGEVLGIHKKEAEIQMGHFRATISIANLQLKARAEAKQPEAASLVNAPAGESPGMELDIRGQVSEDAILAVDQYLDQAYFAQLPWVRIIHGKGSGVLRQIIRDELRHHPIVSSYRSGQKGEGGDGVTVAKLALI